MGGLTEKSEPEVTSVLKDSSIWGGNEKQSNSQIYGNAQKEKEQINRYPEYMRKGKRNYLAWIPSI